MTLKPALLACALTVIPTTAFAVSVLTEDEAALIQQGLTTTADAFVLPAYEEQARAAAEMTDAVSAYCDGSAVLDQAHLGYADTFLAWQRASIIQLGPIADAEGALRVQLWPDPKGFAHRAVRGAVHTQDPALLEDGGLEGRTIALTGLTALEYLLYGELQPDTYDCMLAVSIAEFQTSLAEDLVAQWTPGSNYRSRYDTAADGNDLYPNVEALAREFLAGAVVYVDRLRKFKLLRGLGTEPGTARAERTEARRSDLGLQSIQTSFRTLRDLYEVPLGLFDIAPEIGGSMDYYVLGETAASIADTLAIDDSSLAGIADEDGARAAELRRYADLVLYHESFLKTGFLQSIGLSAGFTAADGD
ncbi:MAG: imelysin family protein [Pseudomonadota bacterium]